MREQRAQVGIIQFVVDDEACIHRDANAIVIDIDCVAVAAGADFLFVNRDLMPRLQELFHADRSNVARAARDQHIHGARVVSLLPPAQAAKRAARMGASGGHFLLSAFMRVA